MTGKQIIIKVPPGYIFKVKTRKEEIIIKPEYEYPWLHEVCRKIAGDFKKRCKFPELKSIKIKLKREKKK